MIYFYTRATKICDLWKALCLLPSNHYSVSELIRILDSNLCTIDNRGFLDLTSRAAIALSFKWRISIDFPSDICSLHKLTFCLYANSLYHHSLGIQVAKLYLQTIDILNTLLSLRVVFFPIKILLIFCLMLFICGVKNGIEEFILHYSRRF